MTFVTTLVKDILLRGKFGEYRSIFTLVVTLLIIDTGGFATVPPNYWTGPSTSTVGTVATYTFDNGILYSNVAWGVLNGSVVSSTQTGTVNSVTIEWTQSGTGTIEFMYDVDIVPLGGTKSVTISTTTPPAPSTTFTVTPNCGNTVVTRNSGPSASYDWYWQTAANGTSTTLGNSATITRTTAGALYLRSRLKNSPYTWSTTSQSVGSITVSTVPPATPSSALNSVSFLNNSTTISVSAVSGATGYKWYTVSSGGVALSGVNTNSYTIISLAATSSFYVSAVSGGCESSSRRMVTVTAEPLPQVQAVGNQSTNMGSTVTLGVIGSYTSYSWRNALNAQVGTGSTYATTNAGNYSVIVTKAGVSGSGVSIPFTVQSGLGTQDMNFVITNSFQIGGVQVTGSVQALSVVENSQTVQYFDGLGRPLQTVVTQGSPARKDIVQPFVYDSYGRKARKYLPVISGTDGWLKSITFDATGNYTGLAANTYTNNTSGKISQDTRPFSETIFEASPIAKPLKIYGAGSAWSPSSGNKFVYSNTSVNSHSVAGSAAQEKVIAWKIDASGFPIRETPLLGFVESGGYYSTGQLLIKITSDENGSTVREYLNKLGQTVLKKVQTTFGAVNLNSINDWALTYYVYDEIGNLRYVFQPELSKVVHNGPDSYVVTSSDLNALSFQYKYDLRGRMIEKRVPGADVSYMVYDSRDRLVMTQDGNMRKDAAGNLTRKEWMITKYDNFDRPVLTAMYTHTGVVDQSAMAALLSQAVLSESYNGAAATHGYTNVVFPTSNLLVLSVTYYDSYSFKALVSGLNYVNTDISGQSVNENLNCKGLITGTKVNILGSSNYLYGVNYYDDRYRALQTISQNHKGGTDRVTNRYDFTGKVLESNRAYIINGSTYSIREIFEYDHAGRLLFARHAVNGAPAVIVNKNVYNELGQLVDKSLHSVDNGVSFKQSTDLRYNIRGWLTNINNSKLAIDANNDDNNDIFGFEIGYVADLGIGANAQYNGNIAAIKWSNNTIQSNILQRGYAFSYDGMNRLKSATQKHAVTFEAWASGGFNEDGITYDLNGNILTLDRTSDNSVTIDDLQYVYGTGNQLLSVTDNSDRAKGFIELNTSPNDYEYDANGNLRLDRNKGITAITYNHLNLPVQVNKGTGEYLIYTYDATGRKISQQVFGSNPKLTDYLQELVFEGNALKFILFSEGRILPDGANWEYQYHLKDHLGNVRTTFSAKETTVIKTATLEAVNAGVEQSNFIRLAEARKIQSYLFDRTNGSAPSVATGYAQRLSGSTNEKFGLARSLSVMPGDVITAEVYAKYIDPVSSNWTSALNTLMTQIAQNTAPAGVIVDGANYAGSTSSFPFPVQAAQNTSSSAEAGPRAYLNWLVFKRDGTFVPALSGYDRISTAAKESGQDVAHERLFSPNVTITDPGFVYIYLSNEEGTPLEVYFDDFKVTQTTKTPIVQSDDYYPFGLTFNSYSIENMTLNPYLYNGKEKQDELGLNWLDFGARMYMPDIGRWGLPDQLADNAPAQTPFRYGFNNPLKFVDPDGRFEMSAEMQRKYPRLASFLKNNMNEAIRNPTIMLGLMKYGELGGADIYRDVQWGMGPKILEGSKEDMKDVYGMPLNGRFFNREPSNIYLNETIMLQLEEALSSNSSAALLLVLSTVLHEYVHYNYLEWRRRNKIIGDYSGFEKGAAFEEYVFGRDIDTIQDALEVIKQFQEKQRQEEIEKKKQGLKTFFSQFSNLASGKYVWDEKSKAWVPKK